LSGSNTSNPVLEQMCQRLFPQHADSFEFELLNDSNQMDRFILESAHIRGIPRYIRMAVIFQIMVKTYGQRIIIISFYANFLVCRFLSWYASDSIDMPEELPVIPQPISIRSKCDNRFFLNYCTFGYTMPYWKWSDWERLIDWMALNGTIVTLRTDRYWLRNYW